MRFTIIIACLAVVTLCPPAQAAPVQWVAGNGHWYEAVHVAGGITWASAQNAAVQAGGYLATIHSDAENAFVFNLAAANDNLWYLDGYNNGIGPWLGGYQPPGSVEPAGGWTWDITGEPWTYAHWSGGEPNNMNGVEDRAHFFGAQTLKGSVWNDIRNGTAIHGYILEIPEPASATLLLLAGVAVLRRRRRRTVGR